MKEKEKEEKVRDCVTGGGVVAFFSESLSTCFSVYLCLWLVCFLGVLFFFFYYLLIVHVNDSFYLQLGCWGSMVGDGWFVLCCCLTCLAFTRCWRLGGRVGEGRCLCCLCVLDVILVRVKKSLSVVFRERDLIE